MIRKKLVEDKVLIKSDETLDLLFNGSLKIIQKKKGYRFSLDAILLAYFTWQHHSQAKKIIELGTGSGVILLILAHWFRNAEIVGVEIQKSLTELANRNIILNGLSERITIIEKDIRRLGEDYPLASFDLVVTNPPFYPVKSGRINPGTEQALARHEVVLSLKELIKISSYLLKSKGRLVMIYPVFRLSELIHQLKNCGLEPKLMRIVYSRVVSEGKLFLLSCSKGGRSALKLLKPLIIYQAHSEYTDEVKEIYRWVGSSPTKITDHLPLINDNSFQNC